jgi:uncharacterized protein (DUF1499 family)
MNKVLFIDFDGVLNNRNHWFLVAAEEIDYENPSSHLSETLIGRLNKIVESTNCNVVISSAWRYHHSLADLKKFLKEKGFKHSEKVIDVTKNISPRNREIEVEEWLTRHSDVTKFAIVDDVEFFFPETYPKEFVQTNADDGLTENNVKRVIEILKD